MILGGTGIHYLDQDPTTEGLVPNEIQSNEAEWAWDTINFNLYYWDRAANAWVLAGVTNPANNGVTTLAGVNQLGHATQNEATGAFTSDRYINLDAFALELESTNGDANPTARFESGGDVYFGADTAIANTNTLFFDQSQGSIYVGQSATITDITTMGVASAAFGDDVEASGANSFAQGIGSVSSAVSTIAMGNTAVASANYAIAIGNSPDATAAHAIAMGNQNLASNSRATAIGGFQNTASGTDSWAGGFISSATGSRAFAFGNSADATANDAIAIGLNTSASAISAVAIGANATATGQNSIAMNSLSTASNTGAVALGANSIASGQNSNALGGSSTASGQNSVALGNSSIASGINSFTLDATAVASGDYSISGTTSTESAAFGQTRFGAFGVEKAGQTAANNTDADWAFNIDMGDSIAARRSLLTMDKRGWINQNTEVNSANHSSVLNQPIAALDLRSDLLSDVNDRSGALLYPMTTAQKNGIIAGNLVAGLMVYDTDLNCYSYYDGTAWTCVGDGAMNTIYSADDNLAGNRVAGLNGNNLTFGGGTETHTVDIISGTSAKLNYDDGAGNTASIGTNFLNQIQTTADNATESLLLTYGPADIKGSLGDGTNIANVDHQDTQFNWLVTDGAANTSSQISMRQTFAEMIGRDGVTSHSVRAANDRVTVSGQFNLGTDLNINTGVNIDNLAVAGVDNTSGLRFNLTANVDWTGMDSTAVGTNAVTGTIFHFTVNGGDLTIVNNSAASTAGNRFRLAGGANIVVRGGGGGMLKFDGANWRLISVHA